MAQILDNTFIAYFLDTTTAPWTPLTGLSATIIIREATWALKVNDEAMTEIWGGWYSYTFSAMDKTKSYVYSCDPNSTSAFIESGVTNTLQYDISQMWAKTNVFQKDYSGNLKDIYSKIVWIDGKADKIIENTSEKLDITPIIDRIDSIEIPEAKLEEKEAKKAIKLIDTLDKKLTSYIESEMSDKEEINAISREFTKLEMEEQMKHKEHMMGKMKKEEEEKKKEEEDDMKELELIKAEFDRMEEEDKMEKKKELEAEIKEKEKELKEMQKELKKL